MSEQGWLELGFMGLMLLSTFVVFLLSMAVGDKREAERRAAMRDDSGTDRRSAAAPPRHGGDLPASTERDPSPFLVRPSQRLPLVIGVLISMGLCLLAIHEGMLDLNRPGGFVIAFLLSLFVTLMTFSLWSGARKLKALWPYLF